MLRYYGLGMLSPGVGLFHMAYSAEAVMTLSVLANREAMPDPALYRRCLEESYAELLAAVKPAAAKPAAKAPARRKKPTAKKARPRASKGSEATNAQHREGAKILAMKKAAAGAKT